MPNRKNPSGHLCGIGKEVGKEDREGEGDLHVLLSPV